MKLAVTLERDELGMIVAECPSIPRGASQGRTEEEALTSSREEVPASLEIKYRGGMSLLPSRIIDDALFSSFSN